MSERNRAADSGPKRAYVSLGAGVQSTALLLLALHGEVEPSPAAAIFADTGAEPAAVYEHLEFLERAVGERIPIVRVSAGNLRQEIEDVATGERPRISHPPVFLRTHKGGQVRRGCTRDYKIRPVERELRRRGHGPKAPIEEWLGISWDETERMKPAEPPWITTRWPLIELRMTRADCIAWMLDHGYPEPPRSACTFCPLHGDRAWRDLRDSSPAEWDDAVDVDRMIRNLPGLSAPGYLHRQRVPLDEVVLAPEDAGQLTIDECGGHCHA